MARSWSRRRCAQRGHGDTYAGTRGPVGQRCGPAGIPSAARGRSEPPPAADGAPIPTRPVNEVAPIDTSGVPAPQTHDAAFRNLQAQFADVHMAPPSLDLTSGGRGFNAAQAALGDNPFGKAATAELEPS